MSRLYRRCGLSNVELGCDRTPGHGAILAGLSEISETPDASILRATGVGADKDAQVANEHAA